MSIFDDKVLYDELDIVCRAFEKAADSAYLTEFYDAREKFINKLQQGMAQEIIDHKCSHNNTEF